ncbi:VOC family protein [Kitasatospora sp. NPDC058397]
MGSLVRHVTIDCADPHGLAQFWAQALDGTLAERIATGNA